MKAIVTKQSDSALLANITKNGQNFATLAYASNGNPRILLKTIAKSGKLSSKEVNATISSFYRETAWQEYTQLGDSYPGLKTFIDWGRNFIENWVISDLLKKNDAYLADDKKTTCFFWIHKDAPQQVKESLRLLEYSGIVAEHSKAVKATRSEVGNRYLVSLGHIMAFLPYPSKTGFDIAKNLTVKRMAEFGLSHLAYKSISESPIIQADLSIEALRIQLQKPVDQLELSNFQIHKIQELGIVSIEDLLRSDVSDLKKAKFIGDKRAARIQNSAIAALFEYLAG